PTRARLHRSRHCVHDHRRGPSGAGRVQSGSINRRQKRKETSNRDETYVMHRHIFLRRAAVFGAVATAGLFALLPVRAQTAGSIITPAALPRSPACVVAAEQVRFDRPLPRTARRLVSGEPIKIVALGSSSTFGAGASTSAA